MYSPSLNLKQEAGENLSSLRRDLQLVEKILSLSQRYLWFSVCEIY